MSYIPDYRKQAYDKFNEHDCTYLMGYRAAIEDAKTFFSNTDIYEANEAEQKTLEDAADCFEDWMAIEEIEMVCAIAESGRYDNVDFEDENPPMYTGTKGVEQ